MRTAGLCLIECRLKTDSRQHAGDRRLLRYLTACREAVVPGRPAGNVSSIRDGERSGPLGTWRGRMSAGGETRAALHGARVVVTGDPTQLHAVQADGDMTMLAQTLGHVQLSDAGRLRMAERPVERWIRGGECPTG
jgi:hypothetical protein